MYSKCSVCVCVWVHTQCTLWGLWGLLPNCSQSRCKGNNLQKHTKYTHTHAFPFTAVTTCRGCRGIMEETSSIYRNGGYRTTCHRLHEHACTKLAMVTNEVNGAKYRIFSFSSSVCSCFFTFLRWVCKQNPFISARCKLKKTVASIYIRVKLPITGTFCHHVW